MKKIFVERRERRIDDSFNEDDVASDLIIEPSVVSTLETSKEYQQLSLLDQEVDYEKTSLLDSEPYFLTGMYYVKDCSNLSMGLKRDIDQLLELGFDNARLICEKLVKDQLIKPERYTTGKPKIYPYICLYLDFLVSVSRLQFVSGDTYNRKYQFPSS